MLYIIGITLLFAIPLGILSLSGVEHPLYTYEMPESSSAYPQWQDEQKPFHEYTEKERSEITRKAIEDDAARPHLEYKNKKADLFFIWFISPVVIISILFLTYAIIGGLASLND